MLIRRLMELRDKEFSLEEWEDLELELEKKGFLMVMKHTDCKLTSFLRVYNNASWFFRLTIYKEMFIEGFRYLKLEGELEVSVSEEGKIRLDKYIPNAPFLKLNEGDKSIYVYLTEEGNFVPCLWKIIKLPE